MTAGRRGLLRVLRHHDLRLVVGGLAASQVGIWAFSVALAVWLLDETGSAGWVAASTVCRFGPSLLMSLYGGVLAERFERVRLMVVLDVVSALTMAALAAEMLLGAHPAVALATSSLVSVVQRVYGPAAAAMTPQLVPARDLGAANALRNTVTNLCVVAGPALAALVLVLLEPGSVVLLSAAAFVGSALMVARVRARSTPVDVTEGGSAGAVRQMAVGVRTILGSAETAALVGFTMISTAVFGTDTVLFVVLSDELLGTGSEGYGYLLAGLGVGGIVAAAFVTRLERLPRLGLVLLAAMATYTLPTLLFLVVREPAVAFVVECVRGAGVLAIEVLTITVLQRSVPSDRLARVFGAFEGVMVLAIVAGAFLTPWALAAFGLTAVIWLLGLVVPLAVLVALPWLRRMDRVAVERRRALEDRVALVARCDLFDDVSAGTIDQVADAASYLTTTAGTVVVAEGEPADAFYVVESGVYAAVARDAEGREVELSEMSAGEWFGEIGLIEAIPRTATVVVRTGGRLLRVDGTAFVDALTQVAPSPALLNGASLRLGRTHPSRPLTRAGLRGPDDPTDDGRP